MPEEVGSTALRQALAPAVVRRSLTIALVVGTVLNSINQGDVLLAGGQPVLWKIALTYCVPFCVATYGAYSAFRMTMKRWPQSSPPAAGAPPVAHGNPAAQR